MRLIDAEKLIDDIKKHNNVSEIKPTWRTKDVITLLEECPHTLPPNPPLTLEELPEMKWEPAWIDGAGEVEIGRRGWAILYCSPIEKYVVLCWPLEEGANIPNLSHYGKTWLAYRRKPEEGEANHGLQRAD